MTHKKENLPKVTLKAQKGHVYTFSIKFNQLDPYIQTRNVEINGIKGIPAFRHGSLLYAPYKKFASLLLVLWNNRGLSTKHQDFKVAFFLKIGLEGGKSKKEGHF